MAKKGLSLIDEFFTGERLEEAIRLRRELQEAIDKDNNMIARKLAAIVDGDTEEYERLERLSEQGYTTDPLHLQ